MQHDQMIRGLEREQLLALNRRVTAITAFVVGPVVIANLGYQAWVQSVWQFWALTLAMVATVSTWSVAHVLTRRGRLHLAAALMMYAALVFDSSAIVLRQDTLAAAALADIGMLVYGWVFAPGLALGGAIFSIASLAGLRVLGHLGYLPAAEPLPWLGVMLDLSIVFSAIPVAMYFLHQRARIGELPYQRLATAAQSQQELLATVARLQPEVDALVGQGEAASRMLASQAHQQAATSENVERAMQAIRAMLAEASTAAQETRELAEATREQASVGRSQLAGASEQLERFQTMALEIQSSMEQLAQQSERTEEVISFIRGIDERLNVLAINAALEAARAGEAGKGFAVVANELRAMLRESTESLSHGRELLAEIREEAAKVLRKTAMASEQLFANVAALREARSTVEDITGSFVATADRVSSIAVAAEQQQSEVGRVGSAMADLRHSASGLTETARALSEGMQRLAREQQEVRELLSRAGETRAA